MVENVTSDLPIYIAEIEILTIFRISVGKFNYNIEFMNEKSSFNEFANACIHSALYVNCPIS